MITHWLIAVLGLFVCFGNQWKYIILRLTFCNTFCIFFFFFLFSFFFLSFFDIVLYWDFPSSDIVIGRYYFFLFAGFSLLRLFVFYLPYRHVHWMFIFFIFLFFSLCLFDIVLYWDFPSSDIIDR